MIKSKHSLFTIPLVLILIAGSCHTLKAIYTILINASGLSLLGEIIPILFLMLITLTPLLFIEPITRSYLISADKLEVKHFFGLSTRYYNFRDLKFSYYLWTINAIQIQLPNGEQMTLSKSLFQNYEELRASLEATIPKAHLEFKYINRIGRILTFILIGSLLLILAIFRLSDI